MARFEIELPNDILNDIKKISDNTDKIFGAMTKAGAEYVKRTIESTAPLQILRTGVKLTKVYKTPSDDGINTKVFYSGYTNDGQSFTRRGRTGGKQYTSDKGTPIGFIAQVTEYGTSPRYTNKGAYRGYVGKKPYFRKAFKANEITKIMMDVQKRESGGLLDE